MKKYDYNNDASADSATENTANEPWAYGTAAMEDHPAASRHPSKGGEWCEVETPDNDQNRLTPELMLYLDECLEDLQKNPNEFFTQKQMNDYFEQRDVAGNQQKLIYANV